MAKGHTFLENLLYDPPGILLELDHPGCIPGILYDPIV